MGMVLSFVQLDLHEAFTVGWSPGIKELHEEISQICEITQYHKAKWNGLSRGWSRITPTAGLGHETTQCFIKIYCQTHILDLPFKIFNSCRIIQGIGMIVDFCSPIFLFERNKFFDFQRKCTNGRMPLREEEIVVLHPKHTVLKCPVSGFAPIQKEEICHMAESFFHYYFP